MLQALAPLGADYIAALDRGFGERVMDAAPGAGKPAGEAAVARGP